MTSYDDDWVPQTSLEVREYLEYALKLDLVGPWAGHPLEREQLHAFDRPSSWYLMGFLIPADAPVEQKADDDEDEEMEEIPGEGGLPGESDEDRKTAKKAFFPSSAGLSFLVSAEAKRLEVQVQWGDYRREEIEDSGEKETIWQRYPREATVALKLASLDEPVKRPLPESGGLEIFALARSFDSALLPREELPPGTRSVSVFLVNRRKPNEKHPDLSYVFQPELFITGDRPFIPRPDPRGAQSEDWDKQVADLHYADTPSYATGHGISADWELVDGECRAIRTVWMPVAEVERTQTATIHRVVLSMQALGELADGQAADTALRPLVAEYRHWIDDQRTSLEKLDGPRREIAAQLLDNASRAASRIEEGIQSLADDPQALAAFRLANRAVGTALRKRLSEVDDPQWRPFQLAFILLNLPSLVDSENIHRETVDLLFFPTGGGKTEAYLGLAAFSMVLRRLRSPHTEARAAGGVSVLMRYTLRLLTLDQLTRAAALVCALELERQEDPQEYGDWPFEIGLWVGKAATPNILGRRGDGRSDTARSKADRFKNSPDNNPSPIPLDNCPWCGARFTPDSFSFSPNDDQPTHMHITCVDLDCEFNGERALPIVAVDELIYRRLPAFLIATVDKFASLPWDGTSGCLLGGADRYDDSGYYGPASPGTGRQLPKPLAGPDLIIQDELHLITGPLGTMTGLYETAIEALCLRDIDGSTAKPKLVASTATVRQARDQVQALFARPATEIFPPPGPNRRDSFFATTVPASESPARIYLGIAAQGRNPKVMMRRVLVPLMAAAERAFRAAGGVDNPHNPADPYMTVLGYFMSLRELGGARRIVEEEVQNTLKQYGRRKRLNEESRLFRDRPNVWEVLELTSRVPTHKVSEARERLAIPFTDKKRRVDCALATNMISVGLDISRLGTMVVVGQPKMHSEYIQATSRVGRDAARPGLVLTLLNMHKPRDRSHYERFRHYHETFYRSVEVGSVTPFAVRAIDRGLAGAVVGLARHLDPKLTPPTGVRHMAARRAELESKILQVFRERLDSQAFVDEHEREERWRSLQDRIAGLLDSWIQVVEDYEELGENVQYQKYEQRQAKPLLRDMLERDFESADHRKFRANRSLRDVEPEVNLFLKELTQHGTGAQQ